MFKELPPKIRFHLLDMMKNVKTNEIQLFVEKLEDISDQCKNATLSNCCEDDEYLFAERIHDERDFILKFIKHLFRGSC